jgi:membrane-associated phospholipid phosphatase
MLLNIVSDWLPLLFTVYLIIYMKNINYLLVIIVANQIFNVFLKYIFNWIFSIYPQLSRYIGTANRPTYNNSYINAFSPSGMPSGHAQFYGLVSTLVMLSNTTEFTAILVFIISSIGAFSRIITRAHTWQQVVIGYIIGLVIALICTNALTLMH